MMESQELAKIATALAEVKGDHREKVVFPNGHGVSIIRNEYSYGGRSGLFEVAVLGSDGQLDYSTAVTDDVIGHLNIEGVLDVMKQVADLPTATSPRPPRKSSLQLLQEALDVMRARG